MAPGGSRTEASSFRICRCGRRCASALWADLLASVKAVGLCFRRRARPAAATIVRSDAAGIDETVGIGIDPPPQLAYPRHQQDPADALMATTMPSPTPPERGAGLPVGPRRHVPPAPSPLRQLRAVRRARGSRTTAVRRCSSTSTAYARRGRRHAAGADGRQADEDRRSAPGRARRACCQIASGWPPTKPQTSRLRPRPTTCWRRRRSKASPSERRCSPVHETSGGGALLEGERRPVLRQP